MNALDDDARRLRHSFHACRWAIVALGTSASAIAGPPYSTDDPAPVDPGHWEVIPFVTGSHESGTTAGETGFDINYGLMPDVQLTLVVPVLYEHSSSLRSGLGRIETEVKWRFLEQDENGPRPEIAFAPTVIWPTAAAEYDSGSASFMLPLWVQKDFGEWSIFGGGGYQINPDEHLRDSWETGIGLLRSVDDRWTFGAEFFHEKPDVPTERSFTSINVGAEWELSENWTLLGSVGPTDFGRSLEAWSFFVGVRAYY
jgi:hypothetical protein